jgi:mono/diheme cytochrome c family protein
MKQANAGKHVPALLVGGGLGFVLLVGGYWLARGSSANVNPPWAVAGPADPFASGKKVFGANCARCHTVGGPTAARPRGSLEAPDLAKVGADPGHSQQWLMDTIRDPQVENHRARMPKFEGKITEGELLALADYLANLKGN